MIEGLFAIAIFGLAAAGVGLGLAIGRGPARTSCGATEQMEGARCKDCPLRRRAREET